MGLDDGGDDGGSREALGWNDGGDGGSSREALVLITAGMMVQTVMVHEKLWF